MPVFKSIISGAESISGTESPLIKQNLAWQLREEILTGRIPPDGRIVEGTWARRFGVAQTSIREALNILAAEGFVQKGHGRSARVVSLSQQDIVQMYQVRAVLEGAAAGLIAEQKMPVEDLERILAEMNESTKSNDLRIIVDCVLRFNLTLCEKSGNAYLIEYARRILIPLFAFTLMRALRNNLTAEPWVKHLPSYRQIVEALQTGDPFFAEQVVVRAVHRFLKVALDVWAHDSQPAPTPAKRRPDLLQLPK